MKGPRQRTSSGDRVPASLPLGRPDLLVVVGLVLAVAAIYGRTAGHHFIYFDDDLYIFANPMVARGLSLEGSVWAFTQFHAFNWHPLTWLSHMLDSQLFGASHAAAGAHHLVSAALHALNATLLFLALRRMTGERWPAAVVAALFAVHPLRVESVAWAVERKDVLSGCFFMFTLLAYARYAERPRTGAYLLVVAGTVLGLLSKPMLVTLPFVLLLLDHWPLRRWSAKTRTRLLLEKLPLLAAAGAVSLVTIRAQQSAGSVASLGDMTVAWRLVGASIAYVLYLWKSLWPSGLTLHYLHPAFGEDLRVWLVPAAACVLLLLGVTLAVARAARARPYALTGWLWYLGMLVPVIGLLQVGLQLWADRYAYLPLVGIYVIVVWGVRDLLAGRPRARAVAGVVACTAVAAYGVAAHVQASKWKDSRTVFEHALSVTKDNWMIENNLGAYLSLAEPASPEARRHLESSLRHKPDHGNAHANLAEVLHAQGAREEARAHWNEALRLHPGLVSAHLGLGNLLSEEGNLTEARDLFEAVLRLDPTHADAHSRLGFVEARSGNLDRAREHFEQALRLDPSLAHAQHGLARWLVTTTDSSRRDPDRALDLARRAAAQTEHRRPEILATLAAAHADKGEYREAAEWQRRALAIAPEDDRALYRTRLQLYEQRRSSMPAP